MSNTQDSTTPPSGAFKIEQGIPTPASRAMPRLYPFKAMKPGDSFFVAGKKEGQRAHTTCRTQKHKGKLEGTWSARSVKEGEIEGVRIWRLT